jgi:hypothetical protein
MGIYGDVKGLLLKSFKFPYSENAKTETHNKLKNIKFPILFVPEYAPFSLDSRDVLTPIYFNSDETTIMSYLQDERKIAVQNECFDHINFIMKEIKNIHRCFFIDHFELNHFYFNIHIWREYDVLITRVRTNSFNFILYLFDENEKLEKHYLIQEILKNEYSKGILSN